jgi:hypothetical protein
MSTTITASDLARAAARLERWGASVVLKPNEPEWHDIRTADKYLAVGGTWGNRSDYTNQYFPRKGFPDALRVILAATHNPDGTPCGDGQADAPPTDTTTPAAEGKVGRDDPRWYDLFKAALPHCAEETHARLREGSLVKTAPQIPEFIAQSAAILADAALAQLTGGAK